MQAVKKNAIMNLALMGAGRRARVLASAVEQYGTALDVRHGKRDMLGAIQPALKTNRGQSPVFRALSPTTSLSRATTQRTDSSRAHFSAVSIPASATSQIMA